MNIEKEGRRDIVVYFGSYIKATKTILTADFQESVLVEIKLRSMDEMMVGCVYRSSSSEPDNITNLRNMF